MRDEESSCNLCYISTEEEEEERGGGGGEEEEGEKMSWSCCAHMQCYVLDDFRRNGVCRDSNNTASMHGASSHSVAKTVYAGIQTILFQCRGGASSHSVKALRNESVHRNMKRCVRYFTDSQKSRRIEGNMHDPLSKSEKEIYV